MNTNETLQFLDFSQQDRAAYIQYSKDFYGSDSVLRDVPAEHFEAAFDCIMDQSPFLRGIMMKENGQNAGYALLVFSYSVEAGGMEIWVEELYIAPEHRRHGIAKAFFAFVSKEYEAKMKRFRLEVMPSKKGLIQFYQQMGFAKLDYFQMYREPDESSRKQPGC